MMPIAFSVFYTAGFIYMIRRKFDLFTLVYLTSIVYFLPALFGITHDGTLPLVINVISLDQYLFYWYYFSLLLVFTWIYSKTNSLNLNASHSGLNPKLDNRDLRIITTMARLAALITPLLLLLAWRSMGSNLFDADKKVILENFSIFYALFQTTSLIFFFASFISGRRTLLWMSVFFILFDLYIGFRAGGAFALILGFAYSLYFNFSTRKTILFAGILVFGYAAASLYKSVTLALKYGLGAGGLLTEFNFDNYVESLLITESFTTQEVFRKTIESNFSLPLEYPLEIIRIVLPGVNNMLLGKGLGFNDYYQGQLFAHIPWGLGSNVWAEQYAIWGWSGPILLTLILFSILYFFNKKMKEWLMAGNIHFFAITLYLLAPAYFYMHRNDFLFQLNLTRNQLVIWLVLFFVAKYVLPTLRKHLRPSR